MGEDMRDNGDDGVSDGCLGGEARRGGPEGAAVVLTAALAVPEAEEAACLQVGEFAGGRRGGALVIVLPAVLPVAGVVVATCFRAARFARIFARSEVASFEAAIVALVACLPKTCL